MGIRQLLAAALLLFFTLASQTMSASAHVLIPEATDKGGAIFHSEPNDEPIAGKPSMLHFELQGQAPNPSSVLLVITGDKQTDNVEVKVTDRVIMARYLFQKRGVYQLKLSMQPLQDKTAIRTFNYTLRVARGDGSAAPEVAPMWAQLGSIISVCGLVGLGLIIYLRAERIAKYSRF